MWDPIIKRLCLGPVAEVDPLCPKNLLLCKKHLLSASEWVLFHSFEPEPPLQWGSCMVFLLTPIPSNPQAACEQCACEQWRIFLPLFPSRGMCWGNLLGSCSNTCSLGRAGLSEVLAMLTVIPQILGVGGGNWTARAVSSDSSIGQAER